MTQLTDKWREDIINGLAYILKEEWPLTKLKYSSLEKAKKIFQNWSLYIIDSGYEFTRVVSTPKVAVFKIAACGIHEGTLHILTPDYGGASLTGAKISGQFTATILSGSKIEETYPLIVELGFMKKLIENINAKDLVICRHGPLIHQIVQYTRERYRIQESDLKKLLTISCWEKTEIKEFISNLEQIDSKYSSASIILKLVFELLEVCKKRKTIPAGVVERISRSRIILRHLLSKIYLEILNKIGENPRSPEQILYELGLRTYGLARALYDSLIYREEAINEHRLALNFCRDFLEPEILSDTDFFVYAANKNIMNFPRAHFTKPLPRLEMDRYAIPQRPVLKDEIAIREAENLLENLERHRYEILRTYVLLDDIRCQRELSKWEVLIGIKIREPLIVEFPMYLSDDKIQELLSYMYWCSVLNRYGFPIPAIIADYYAKLKDVKLILEILERKLRRMYTPYDLQRRKAYREEVFES